MSVNELFIQFLRSFFVIIIFVTAVDYLRNRDNIRRDVAIACFCMSITSLTRIILSIKEIEADWLLPIAPYAFLAQPVLLLRLLGYFRPVPQRVYWAAGAGMLISWSLLFFLGKPISNPVQLVMAAYVVLVNGYTALNFADGASKSAGVVHQRLLFGTIASVFLIVTLFFMGIRIIDPSLETDIAPTIQFSLMLTITVYYLGFVPPRWFRLAWQYGELRNYLQNIPKSNDRSAAEIFNHLESAVSRSMGTVSLVLTALWDQKEESLVLQESAQSVDLSDVYLDGAVRESWNRQQPQAIYRVLNPQDAQMMKKLDKEMLLTMPISTSTSSPALGMLIVFLQHRSLFVEDDIQLLSIFTQQTAVLLENRLMLDTLHRQTEDLEQKVQERTAALQRSNDELQLFAYIASHDLQEPLRMVSSYLQLIEQRYKDKLDDDGREFIAYAVGGAARMRDLINDVLIYSRVGTQKKDFVRMPIENVLNETLVLLDYTITESKAVITHDPLPEVRVDKNLMIQVFQNLISNAIKYRSDRTPEIHISAERENKYWVFCVRDNGIGIEQQYLEKIFVIFQRLHDRSKYPGTGIGLAVCKKTIELHGGRMWAESQVDRGTTFYFTLPA